MFMLIEKHKKYEVVYFSNLKLDNFVYQIIHAGEFWCMFKFNKHQLRRTVSFSQIIFSDVKNFPYVMDSTSSQRERSINWRT